MLEYKTYIAKVCYFVKTVIFYQRNNVGFIRLTNNGHLPYLLSVIESLINKNFPSLSKIRIVQDHHKRHTCNFTSLHFDMYNITQKRRFTLQLVSLLLNRW